MQGERRARLRCRHFSLGWLHCGPGLSEYGGRAGSWGLLAGLQTPGPLLFCPSTQGFVLANKFQMAQAEIPVGRKSIQDGFSPTHKFLCLFSFWVLKLGHCGKQLILVACMFLLESLFFFFLCIQCCFLAFCRFWYFLWGNHLHALFSDTLNWYSIPLVAKVTLRVNTNDGGQCSLELCLW